MERRKHLRLPGYDYSAEGAYFVTIVCHDRRPYFGKVVDKEMVLGPIGIAADNCWKELPHHFNNVRIDVHQVMPEHFHGILFLDDVKRVSGILTIDSGIVQLNNATDLKQNATDSNQNATDQSMFFSRISPKKGTLGVIIRTFKAAVTTWCRSNGYPEFGWQSLYYDRIIRNNEELDRIRQYIRMNPQNYHKKAQ